MYPYNISFNYAFMQQVIRHLPAWKIIYISPHEDRGMPAAT